MLPLRSGEGKQASPVDQYYRNNTPPLPATSSAASSLPASRPSILPLAKPIERARPATPSKRTPGFLPDLIEDQTLPNIPRRPADQTIFAHSQANRPYHYELVPVERHCPGPHPPQNHCCQPTLRTEINSQPLSEARPIRTVPRPLICGRPLPWPPTPGDQYCPTHLTMPVLTAGNHLHVPSAGQ